MSKKYIIELEDEPFGRNDDPNIPHGMDELWRVAGFNSLVFDKNGLERLEPLENVMAGIEVKAYQQGYEYGFREGRTRSELSDAQDDDYQRGCKDAWDMAKRITLEPRDYKDSIPVDKLREVFGTPYAYRVFQEYSYQEVVSMLNATVECKDEICVGDIVRYKKDDHLDLYVLKVYDDKLSFKGLVISDSRAHSCGDTISLCFIDDYVKTGRHHDFGKILEFIKS